MQNIYLKKNIYFNKYYKSFNEINYIIDYRLNSA